MEVIKEIIHSLSPKSKEAVVGEKQEFVTNQAYIKEFYEDDANSRMMPGKKRCTYCTK